MVTSSHGARLLQDGSGKACWPDYKSGPLGLRLSGLHADLNG